MAEHLAPVVPGSAVGIIPNPMSGRDIRRVVAQASVFPNTEKTSMALRIIRAVGALGVERVLLSTDAFGIAAGVLREVRRLRAAPPPERVQLPEIEFLTLPRAHRICDGHHAVCAGNRRAMCGGGAARR